MKIIEDIKLYLGDFYGPTLAAIKIIFVIIISIIIIKVGSIIIKKIFEKQKSLRYRINSKKLDTMSSLFVSIFRYAVYIVAGTTIITYIDVFKFESVIAAAGVGGIVLGLGAQSLIKDIISGFFIVMEDQFVVGDLISLDDMTGTVEELELRITKLRSFNGDLFIIPNGDIKRVTNHTRGNKAVIVDIPIAYSSDINKVVAIANNVCESVSKEFDTLTDPPKVLGITDMGKDSMNLRIMAKTVPNEQWEVERRIRKVIKEEFDKEKLEFFDKNKIYPAKE